MKRDRQIKSFILMSLMCLVISGCAGSEILDEIPRDFGVKSTQMTESTENTVTAEPEVPETTPVVSEEEESDAHCFLWNMPDGYAYSCLSAAEQIWYRDMERILGYHLEEEKLSEEGLAQGLSETDIDKIFQCVLNDHPELFYVEGYSYTKYTLLEKITDIAFSGTYNVDEETAREKERQIEAAAEDILSGIEVSASDYDKVKYVYDTLICETDYQLDSTDNQNIYSVFVNHASVCQGYAKATQYLLNRLGVECTLVLGTVDTGEGHAWNLVKVDGSYYYVDSTWGDASYQMEEEATGLQMPAMPEINYDYLNVTTEELLRTHKIDSNVPMPACVATEANYYVREGALFSSYDREQMADLFSSALEQGRDDVTVKCTDETCYTEILTALIDNQEIFKYLSDAGSSVAYAQNDKQMSLTFWMTNE